MSVRKAVRSLVKTMTKAEQLELFLYLRDDEALKAYRFLSAEVDRTRQSSRVRISKRTGARAELRRGGARQTRVAVKEPTDHASGNGRLRAYTAEEFLKL